jgi:DNA polymerase I-like protein with 3'-5' exonuclease and polymerase domains
LLKHWLDENTKHGLKIVAELWKTELGFNPHKDAAQEQRELGQSIIRNGGTFNQKTKHIWRASPEYMSKYGCSDTFLCFGIFKEGMRRFKEEYKQEHIDLFYDIEIMPLCKEVAITMQRKGTHINVEHFKKIHGEVIQKMEQLEDQVLDMAGDLLEDFPIGKSIDEEITKVALIKKIIELESLPYPQKFNKKENIYKDSLAKDVIKKEYEKEPHWLWGYLIGEDELKYSEQKLNRIKNEMYREKIGRRYRFSVSSPMHLRWLFIDKLGYDAKELPQTDAATAKNPIPSMKAEVLEDYFLKNHDFVKPLLLWKKLQKLESTYIRPALELNIDGVLYMNMNQSGTTSGRFSCTGGYNLQTLPKVEEVDRCRSCDSKKVKVSYPIELLANMICPECGHEEHDVLCSSAIKKGFIAPKGMKIVNADYSSLEPRCFAMMSSDAELKRIYWDNLDMYSKVYCDTLDEEGLYSADPDAENYLKKLNKKGRDLLKPVILGITYGSRGPQVANLMNFKTTRFNKKTQIREEVTDFQRGQEYRDHFLSTYKDLYKYMLDMEAQAMERGWVENIIGRRRSFKFAPALHKLFKAKRIDYNKFLDTAKRNLQKTAAIVDDTTLTSDDLRDIFNKTDTDIQKAKDKGNYNWAYIKSKFKNDLDTAKNYPIQSLAAHICNMGMLESTRYFKEAELENTYIFIQVHDEISCYTPEKDSELTVELLRLGMEDNIFANKIDIPMIAEPIVADTLKEAK